MNIWSVCWVFRHICTYPIHIQYIYEGGLNPIWQFPISCTFLMLTRSCCRSNLHHLRGKKIRIGSLKTCCVKATMINVHVDLIGMHYPLDAMMVPADFYERRLIVDVMNPKWLSSISLRRLWIGFVWLSHSPKIQQLFTSQLPELRRSSRFVAVSCGRRHFLDSLKGNVCVFSPLCSQLVNISSEIKWLHRLQHVFDSPFDSSSPYVYGKSGSQSAHIFCVILAYLNYLVLLRWYW